MKFFHLSDLHIGLKLFNRDLREDQEYILRQITDLAVREQPEAVVIAGDIYDKAVPSAEAVEVFDRFIAGLNAVSYTHLPNVPRCGFSECGGGKRGGVLGTRKEKAALLCLMPKEKYRYI